MSTDSPIIYSTAFTIDTGSHRASILNHIEEAAEAVGDPLNFASAFDAEEGIRAGWIAHPDEREGIISVALTIDSSGEARYSTRPSGTDEPIQSSRYSLLTPEPSL